jgi:hypothetical protein
MSPNPPIKTVEAIGVSRAKLLSAIEPHRRPYVERKLKEMPESMKNGYLKAVVGRASPRAVIKALCLECMGYQRGEIPLCTSLGCAAYLYRPYREENEKNKD